jgi:predicted DNA-binding transcriptional regulator YafY
MVICRPMAAARKKRCPSPASPNRHGTARRLDVRLRQLFEVLQKGGFPNATTLGRELEVSTRTIRRDIELLRDYHHIEVRYDETRHGFYLTDPTQPFPGAAFTESELLALIIARQALAAHRGSPLEQILTDGFKRLESRLDNEQTYTLDTLGSLISFHDLGHEDVSTEIFHTITQALRARRVILFRYQGLKDERPRERRVHPYHLGNHNQKWYLFALDPAAAAGKDNGIRSFALSRISQLRLGKGLFQRPVDFNPAEHLRGSFGIHSGDPATEIQVIIRFDAWATRLVEERQWHASQDLIHHTDPPGCTLTLRLTSMAEVKRWILSWGRHATVLAPPQLQEELRQAAYSILANTPSRADPKLP